MKVGEMGGEAVDEQDFFPCLGMDANDGVLGVGIPGLECQAFLDGHDRAERRFDTVASAQRFDHCLGLLG
ncbi:hypothetical protein D3C78_1919570 [compost metagenome]